MWRFDLPQRLVVAVIATVALIYAFNQPPDYSIRWELRGLEGEELVVESAMNSALREGFRTTSNQGWDHTFVAPQCDRVGDCARQIEGEFEVSYSLHEAGEDEVRIQAESVQLFDRAFMIPCSGDGILRPSPSETPTQLVHSAREFVAPLGRTTEFLDVASQDGQRRYRVVVTVLLWRSSWPLRQGG